MRQVITRNGTFVVRCLPGGFHSVEGGGVELFTPQVRQSRTVRRCVADPAAQHFLGWRQEWIDDVLGPDPRRIRFDPRPQPWMGEFFMLGIRRMRSREIIGHAWITFEDGVAEASLGFRSDQRRAGLAMFAGFAGAALLHRHFGYREIKFHTEITNEGINKVSSRTGHTPDDDTTVRELPNGRTVETNVYRSVEPDVVSMCGRMARMPASGADVHLLRSGGDIPPRTEPS